MQLGCVAKIDQAAVLHEAGYDYIEAGVASLVPDEDDAVFEPILTKYRALEIPVRAFNGYLPGDLKIVGPQIDEARVRRYAKRSVARIREVGATRAVMGSAVARRIPQGYPQDKAVEQIVHFLTLLADEADGTELVIAIEPLNLRETNVINSVVEGMEIAKMVDRPSIKVLADFYHMDEENEPLSNVVKCKDYLEHVHVADTNRRAPGTGRYQYAEFARLLGEAGYEGMVSIECRWKDLPSEAGPSLEFLREVFRSQA